MNETSPQKEQAEGLLQRILQELAPKREHRLAVSKLRRQIGALEGRERRGELDQVGREHLGALRKELQALRLGWDRDQETFEAFSQRKERGDLISQELAWADRVEAEVSGLSETIDRISELEDQLKELEDAAAPEEQKRPIREELEALHEAEPWMDNEEAKRLLREFVPPAFQSFFEKYCRLIYEPRLERDTVEFEVEANKLTFRFGPKTLYEENPAIHVEGKPLRVIRPERLRFQIGRLLGLLLAPPAQWESLCKKMRIIKGKELPSWEDFVGLCLTARRTAEELAPEAFEAFSKAFRELQRKVELGQLKLNETPIAKRGRHEFDEPNVEVFKEKKPGVWERIPFLSRVATIYKNFAEIFKGISHEFDIWFDMTLHELELEEAKRIQSRQEHVSDRDKRLWYYIATGDKIGARGLILSAVQTADHRRWRLHLYAQAFDPLYRQSAGKLITRESYSFFVRCDRESQIRARREGSKIGEYYWDEERNCGRRMDRDDWIEEVREEIAKRSARMVNTTGEETFDWMRVNFGQRPAEIDEFFNGEEPLAFREGWAITKTGERPVWESERYTFETGDLTERHLPRDVLERSLGRGDVGKLDADQLGILARFMAIYSLADLNEPWRGYLPPRGWAGDLNRGGGGLRNLISGQEHTRQIVKELIDFYHNRIRQYQEWKRRTGKTNEHYERFIELVGRFKDLETRPYLEIQRRGLRPTEEALARLLGDPQFRLHRPTREIVADLKMIEDAWEGGGGLKEKWSGEITKLDSQVEERLKEKLIKNPELFFDVLSETAGTMREWTVEFLEQEGVRPGEVDPEEYGRRFDATWAKLHASARRLREWYEESANRRREIEQMIQLFNLHTKGDVAAFSRELEDRAETTLQKALDAGIKEAEREIEEVFEKWQQNEARTEDVFENFEKQLANHPIKERRKLSREERQRLQRDDRRNLKALFDERRDDLRQSLRVSLLSKTREKIDDILRKFEVRTIAEDGRIEVSLPPGVQLDDLLRSLELVRGHSLLPNFERDGPLWKRHVSFIKELVAEEERLGQPGARRAERAYLALKALRAAIERVGEAAAPPPAPPKEVAAEGEEARRRREEEAD